MELPRRSQLIFGITCFVVYSATALIRHRDFLTAEDSALFGQAVKAYSRFEVPNAPLKSPNDFNLLGDHFHPIVALLGPLYRLWPHIEILFVAQAFLFALAALIFTRAARRIASTGPALMLGTGFALAWGIQGAVSYEFHEIAFGAPIVAASLAAMLRDDVRQCCLWAASLVLVKEDLCLTVAAIGIVLVLRGYRRAGGVLCLYGIASFLLVVFFVIPELSYYGRFTYWSSGPRDVGFVGTAQAAAQGLFNGWLQKIGASLALLLPTAFLALRSPLVLIAVPSLGIRFLSDREAMWGLNYHYNAVPAVILAFAGLAALRGQSVKLIRYGSLIVLALALCVSLRTPILETAQLTCINCAAKRQLLAKVPDGATVAADPYLTPHLVDRTTTYLFTPSFTDSAGDRIEPEYVLTEQFDSGLLRLLASRGYLLEAARNDVRLFRLS